MTAVETYSFGEWLKRRRKQLRLTQRELAASAYCSVAMIKKIEADERRPSSELAGLLAVSLKIPGSDQEAFIEAARGERPVDSLWPVQDEDGISTLPVHTPAPLPQPPTPLIGRADELSELGQRLAQPHCRLLTLVGPGGIGKTRLAIASAESQPALFAEGVAYVSLAAITDAGIIPNSVASSLRLTLSGPPGDQVLAYLRRRNMLLVLDNCEQLDGDLTWLSDLLAHAPGVKLLATSRERLHLVEEWVYAVPQLVEAVDLFVQMAQRVKQDFDVQAEQPAVLRICQLVENLPLAVELAASWTPHMPCAQIADRIRQDINVLATDVRNIPARHRSMHAVFDQSWNLLSPAEQNALMRLSVFHGDWQLEEALPVAEADLLMLRRLVDKSLVRVAGNGRYNLHELIRQYASHKLAQSGLESEAQQRHFDAYLALAGKLDAQQFGPQAMPAVARFDQEQDNIRAALAWSLATEQTQAALRLLYHMWFYWSRRGHHQEGADWAIRAIDQAGELESLPLCAALSSAAVFSFILGRFSEGESLAIRALSMARRLEDPEATIMALSTHTFASVNIEQALKGLREGIALIEETGQANESLPLFYLGAASWFHSSGRYEEAGDYYRKSIALFRQMGTVDFIANPLSLLGQLALQEGRLQEAYDLTVESIAATRATGYDVAFDASGGARLGLIQLYLGEFEAAQQSIEEALRFFEDGGAYERARLEALSILSEVMLARGDVNAAAKHLRASLNICEIFYRQLQATKKLEGTPDALPVDLIGLCSRAALVAAAQGNYERAVTLCSIADSLRSQSQQLIIPALQARLDETMAAIRADLSQNAFDTVWQAGQRVTLSQAFSYLLT